MIALITGASAGIGKACAYKFSEKGYNLIVTGRRESKLKELQVELEMKFNNKIEILAFDIQDENEVQNAFSSLKEDWMNIDVLVNNAGLALGREGIDVGSMDDYNIMIDTNIKGLLYVSKAVMPIMKKRKSGHIINLSSTAAKEVYPGGGVYCATKHAVDALTKGMRIDLLSYGIKVSSISPGMVDTEFSRVRFKGDEEQAAEVYKGFTPLYAEDVAEVISYVASLPKHVNVNDLVLTCTAQANSFFTFKE